MSRLHISLFGKFCIHCDGEEITGLDSLKAQELFSYLLLHRQRPHTREKLAALLWMDSSAAQSKRYLRQALWQLQAGLNSNDPAGRKLILADSEWIQLNNQADFQLDVALLEEAFAAVQGRPGASLDAADAARLRQAAQQYRGDLLENWYQDWCLFERQRLQSVYLVILDKLMEYSEFRQEYEMGAVYAAYILQYDQAREQTHRRLMRLRYLAGDRTGALRHYQRCAQILQLELGVKPSRRTEELYRQIAADQLPQNGTAPLAFPAPTTKSPFSLPDILKRLHLLKDTLHNAEEQVEQEIKAVESWLDGHPQ